MPHHTAAPDAVVFLWSSLQEHGPSARVVVDVSPRDFWIVWRNTYAKAKTIASITGCRHAELRLGTYLRQAGLQPNRCCHRPTKMQLMSSPHKDAATDPQRSTTRTQNTSSLRSKSFTGCVHNNVCVGVTLVWFCFTPPRTTSTSHTTARVCAPLHTHT